MFTEKDRLRVKGRDIINGEGKKIRLRGTNFGGWLMREGWMDGGSACRVPLNAHVVKREEHEVVLDLGKRRVWNRVECHTEELTGEYSIEISDDGQEWRMLYAGSFADRRRPTVEEGCPAPYKLYENTYDDGCFACDGTIHVNETSSRYVRVLASELPEEINLGYYGDMDEYTSRLVLEERFGRKKTEEILQAYQDAYIQEWDLKFIKELGMNFVRVPIYWQVIMTPEGTIRENAWKSLDWLTAQCNELEIYVMLDHHGAPGAQTGGSLTCGQIGSNELWTNPVYQQMSEEIVSALTRRYCNCPCVCMIDILNEPLPVYNEELPADPCKKQEVITEEYIDKLESVMKKLYSAVRQASDEMIVSVNLFYEYHTLKAPREYGWENVVYQTHTYGLGDWRNQDAMIRLIDAELEEISELKEYWQVPVLSGESNFWGHEGAWRKWLTDLNRLDIHWATWTYKNTDPVKRDTWGILYDFQGKLPDYYRDSEEILTAKLKDFDSAHYRIDQDFVKLLTGCVYQIPKPIRTIL